MSPEPQGWHLELVGLAWWLILPLAALAAWGIVRLMGWELSPLPQITRRALSWLRGGAVAVVVLLLLEPTLTHTSVERELPSVAVLVDRSGSMDVTDAQMSLAHRIDEAVALGLIDGALRPDAPRQARRELSALASDLPVLSAAVVATQEAWAHGQLPASREQAVHLAEFHAAKASAAGAAESGDAAAAALFKLQGEVLARARTLLGRERPDPSAEKPEAIAAALDKLGEQARALLPKLDAAQEASDQALLAKPEVGAKVKAGLEKLRPMSRFERACRMTREKLAPLLAERSQLKYFAMDDSGLTPIEDLAKPGGFAPAGTTDFATPFSALARTWADQKHVGAVVLVSDGRQTAGVDPVPAVRALAARGAKLAGVLVGDPGEVRDAVVADVQAPPEVFRGETVRLDTRFRITGFPKQDWNLVLTRDGAPCETRVVRGDGHWQTERFELPNAEAGVHNYQARLERVGGHSAVGAVSGGGGLLRELWNGIGGYEVRDFTTHASFAGKPTVSVLIPSAEVVDDHENYGERLRGYVIPPSSGPYVFYLSADDKAELWLSTSADPAGKVKIADVFDWVERGVWDKYESQHSQPVVLEKGKAYYVEVLHKQAGGGGHVAVGWQLPDKQQERPITGARLSPFGADALKGDIANDVAEAEASLANNQADCSVTVNDDPLKVLVVDASPRWESRFLVNLFERDKRVEVVRRYNAVREARGERELLPPTQEALDAFDVVVIGDLAPGEMKAEDQQHLEKFVSRRGGFAVFVAGPRGMPASYALGGIANVLPVRVVASATGPAADQVPATVAMTKAAAENPIVAVLDDAALNRKLWTVLPPLQWIARGVTAKPGAEVLLETQDDLHVPVVAANRFGAGRVLWVGSPEVWRWRDRLGDRVHQTFWLQSVRWGLGIRLRGKDPRLQAALDRTLVAPRESAELRVRARTASGQAVEQAPHARLVRLDDKGQPIPSTEHELELAPVVDSDGLWHVTLGGLAEGHWRIAVTSPHPDLAGLSEVRDLVVRAHQSQEGIELGADFANLNRLAMAGGFRADTLDQSVPLIRELAERLEPKDNPRRTTHSLWDNYGALLLVLGLLSFEWLWRKRLGLP